MTRIGPGATIALLALAGAACEPSIMPNELSVSVQAAPAGGSPAPLVVVPSHDTVRITGSIEMNEPCYDFSGTAAARSDSLLVTLIASRSNEMCLQVVTTFAYTMTVARVPAGSYALHLVYDRRGPPTSVEAALDQPVVVP